MAFEYPDVMNDILDARKRFESGTVQYLAQPPADPVAANSVVQVPIVLQSVMDVPIQVAVHIALPELNRKLRRLPQPLFQLYRSDIQFQLAPAEVAELVVPIQIQPDVPPDEYRFAFHVRSQAVQEGMRVRLDHGENRVGDILIRHPQGLRIAQLASWGYEAKKANSQPIPIVVTEAAEAQQEVDLKPQFNTVWTPDDWELVASARQEVNDRRFYIVPELIPEALYVSYMQESQMVFGDCGVKLYVGEAIFLAKMLTYTVTYMMRSAEWQDCLLVPIYAFARANEHVTDNALSLVTQVGYTHVIELAIALSFALVEDVLERTVWSATEQRVVRDFVTGCLADGSALPTEFLYLPLILGGIAVADQVVMEGEDVTDSLRLLGTARSGRAEMFADEELHDLVDAYDRLIAKKARGRRRS